MTTVKVKATRFHTGPASISKPSLQELADPPAAAALTDPPASAVSPPAETATPTAQAQAQAQAQADSASPDMARDAPVAAAAAPLPESVAPSPPSAPPAPTAPAPESSAQVVTPVAPTSSAPISPAAQPEAATESAMTSKPAPRVHMSPNAAEHGLQVSVSHSPAPSPLAPPRAAQPAPEPIPAAPPAPASTPDSLFDNFDDGFGEEPFPTATSNAPKSPKAAQSTTIDAQIEAIRLEGLTGRQLRNATRLALRHNLSPSSEYDAVRLLREAGIDPFQTRSMIDIGRDSTTDPASGDAIKPLPGDGVRLPKTVQPIDAQSSTEQIAVNHAKEIENMQREIARRRRTRLALLFTRLFVFVFLPTIAAGWYFAFVATPQYGTKSEFAVQMAESPMAASGMGGLLQGTSMATAQDSIAVQGYLDSRDAMLRLERDVGFRQFFSGDDIDPLLRLAPDASLEDAYKLYRSHILISYDPTEGIIRMEVIAPSAELSVKWSQQLIAYAEEQVDQLTSRLREDAMRGARESYEDAEKAVIASQERMLALQEQFKILSTESEIALLTQHIGSLETQIMTDRLSITQMEANPTPNLARMEPIKRRIKTMEDELSNLRKRLTEGESGGKSLAQVQGQLLVAQADVETRQLILAQSVQAMENARIEANRQTRYLSTSVSPIPPDVPTYPRIFENTAVTLLILLGIYLMISMTVAILREQVSS